MTAPRGGHRLSCSCGVGGGRASAGPQSGSRRQLAEDGLRAWGAGRGASKAPRGPRTPACRRAGPHPPHPGPAWVPPSVTTPSPRGCLVLARTRRAAPGAKRSNKKPRVPTSEGGHAAPRLTSAHHLSIPRPRPPPPFQNPVSGQVPRGQSQRPRTLFKSQGEPGLSASPGSAARTHTRTCTHAHTRTRGTWRSLPPPAHPPGASSRG